MKILEVCPRYYPFSGGVESHVKAISERLVMKGYQIEVLTTDPAGSLPKEETINGVKIRRFGAWAPSENYHVTSAIGKAVREAPVRIVHLHDYYDITALSTLFYARKDQRVLFTFHSGGASAGVRRLIRIPYNFVMRRVIRRTDKFICVSEFEYHYFSQLLGLPNSKFEVIPNGVDPKKFENVPRENVNPPIMLAVGRSEKYKGTQRVLKGFKVFCDKHPEANLKLYVLGNARYDPSINGEIDRLDIRGQVRLLGWISDSEYVRLLKRSNLFILLSDYEGGPISVAEAAFARTPAVLSMNSGMIEYIERGCAVGVCNSNDPIEVSEKISLVLNNPNSCTFKGYCPTSWDDAAEQICKLYNVISDENWHRS